MVRVNDGPKQDTRLYQESVQTLSPFLAQAVYRGRVAARHNALEQFRKICNADTSTSNPDGLNAADFTQEEALSVPGLDGLTRFTYRNPDQTTANTIYIGWVDNRVFVLNCSGAVDSKAALELLVQRLAQD